MIDTTTISDAPIVTYGPTLARSMTEEDMRRFFASIDESRAIGMAHVVICKSHLPNQVNVECLLDGVPASDAIVALEVAIKQLRHVHGLDGAPLMLNAIAELDAT